MAGGRAEASGTEDSRRAARGGRRGSGERGSGERGSSGRGPSAVRAERGGESAARRAERRWLLRGSPSSDDGPTGFLFAPRGSRADNLVIVLPAPLGGRVVSLTLRDLDGEVLPNGHGSSCGIGSDGRERFAFPRAGGELPRDLTVQVVLEDGSVGSYVIPDPTERYE